MSLGLLGLAMQLNLKVPPKLMTVPPGPMMVPSEPIIELLSLDPLHYQYFQLIHPINL